MEPKIHPGCSVWCGAVLRMIATSASAGDATIVHPRPFAAALPMPSR
jgi:hypothetical protein